MRRSARHGFALIALLLLGGAAYLLFAGSEDGTPAGGEGADDAVDEALRDMLVGEGAALADAHPTLAGRAMRPEDAGRGDVLVTVLGPSGVPLEGIAVVAFAPSKSRLLINLDDVTSGLDDSDIAVVPPPPDDPKAAQSGVSARDGTIRLRDLPWDGSIHVTSSPPHALDVSVAVSGPRVELRLRRGLPISLECRDAESGAPMYCNGWSATPVFEGKNVVTAAGEPVIAVAVGAQNAIEVSVPDVRDYVRWDSRKWNVWIAPGVKRLRAVYPQRPVADVSVSFPREYERERWGAGVEFAGTRVVTTSHVDSFHQMHVQGIPHLQGERIAITGASTKGGTTVYRAEGRLPERPRDPLLIAAKMTELSRLVYVGTKDLNVKVADFVGQEITLRPRIISGGVGYRVQVVATSGKALELWFANSGTPPPATGAFELTVRRPDGRPATNARVYVGRHQLALSGNGTVYVTDLAAGEHEVRVWGAGAAFTRKISIYTGQKTKHDWTAPRGGNVDLEVVDEQGRPVPFATLTVTQTPNLPWVDVDGDEQRIDPFTDEAGRRRLHGLSGRVTVTASFGSRKGSASVNVGEGQTEPLRVQLGKSQVYVISLGVK